MTAGPIMPQPGRISEPEPVTDMSTTERKQRNAEGPRTRLTVGLIEQYADAVAAGLPRNACSDYIGVDRVTVWRWLQRGRDAADTRWSNRSQLDRLCIRFVDAVRRAEGEHAMNVTRALSQAAGLSTKPVVVKTTRRRIRAGEEVEVVIEEREVPVNVTALLTMARARFPEYREAQPSEDESQVAPVYTPEQVVARIIDLRNRRRAAGLDKDIIEANGGDTEAESTQPQGGACAQTPDQD